MDKDEILERSRKEHKDRDFVEDEALAHASKFAVSIGCGVSGLLTVIQSVFQDHVDYGLWTVMFSILATTMLVKFSRMRKRHELIGGLGYLVLAIFFLVCFLWDVLREPRWTRV